MELRAPLATGGTVGAGDFTDITPLNVSSVGWGADGRLSVVFDGNLSAEQQARVRRRIQSTSRTEEDLRAACEAWADVLVLHDLLAVNAQVRRLTRLVLRANL